MTPNEALQLSFVREAVGRGFISREDDRVEYEHVKINFATEIKNAFTRGLKAQLDATEEIDLRKTFPPAMDAVTELVAEKMKICQGEGAGT